MRERREKISKSKKVMLKRPRGARRSFAKEEERKEGAGRDSREKWVRTLERASV